MKKKIIFAILIIIAGFAVYYFFLRPGPKFIPPESAQKTPQFSALGKIENISDKDIILMTENLNTEKKKIFEEVPMIEKRIAVSKETVLKKPNKENMMIIASLKDLEAGDTIFVLSEEDMTAKNELTAKEIILMPRLQ